VEYAYIAHVRNFPNLKDDFGPERGPPQRNATETGEEAYEAAIVSDIEREAMRGLLESVC